MEMETLFVPNRLSEILKGIAEWMSRPDLFHNTGIPWTESHISATLDYVLKMEAINHYFCVDLRAYLCINKFWRLRFQRQNSKNFGAMVSIFMLEIRGLFHVPRLQHCLPDKNALVAAFITFLVQLLDHETELIVSCNYQISRLKKELRFLVTILGDTPFQATDDQGIEKLLAEFEAVASEAGYVVRSFIFAANERFIFGGTDEALRRLLQQIRLLKPKIIEFSHSLPDNMKQKTCVVESNFIVDNVLNDLEDLMNREDDPLFDVKDQIKVLHQGLSLSQSLFKDIKLSRHLEIEELNELAMRTRDVAYEAEYLINTFLIRDVPIWYLTMRYPQVMHKIGAIVIGLQEIMKNYDSGALQVAKDLGEQLSLQSKRDLDVDEIVVGFEEVAIKILDKLVRGTEHLRIVSIVGMPGIGKTTLAKKLYNHPSVNDRFDKSSWCVVSQTYQRKNLFIDILIGLGSKLDKDEMWNKEEQCLGECIHKMLKGRRFLIVMDDIWDSNVWYDFRRYFPNDENGSRVLLTSRNTDAAPPSTIMGVLPLLSKRKCWELLRRKVFQNEPCPPQLLKIGKEIAANCNGLPLAVVVIAGILSTMEKEKSTWRNVKRSLASYILLDQNSAVMQILKLSYKHLPEHLKPCFLYFGAFPEHGEITVKKLKWLWIAEGFIRKEENKSIESVAEEYLVELINKSLLIVTKRRSNGGAKACVVHDLLRDLCLKIAEEENFLKSINGLSIYEKHHRLSICTDAFNGSNLGPFGSHVRSFLFHYLKSVSLWLGDMKLLRVLDFPGNLVGGIELLVHLKYLAIKCMPASLRSPSSFVNLEFLILTRDTICVSDCQKMVKLRYLIAHKAIFDEQNCKTSHTNNLEYLSTLEIKTPKDVEMLRWSPHLRTLKCTCWRFCDNEQGEYRYPNLHFLSQLESLKIFGDVPVSKNFTSLINFPSNIRKLTLSRLGFPWEDISIIGELPNLQVLKLELNAFYGETWETKDGEFQQLIFLKLCCLYIAKWNVATSEHFPKLQRLVLEDCRSLQEIPYEIGEIATLQLIEVDGCQEAVTESVRKIQQEQKENGIEDLKVIIGNTVTTVPLFNFSDSD